MVVANSYVEVFRTSVRRRRVAAALLRQLQASFPTYRFVFDLPDCDRVLRAECPTGPPDAAGVAALLHTAGYACTPLPD